MYNKALYTDQEFWMKRNAISYVLSIFVFFIHNSSYAQYTLDENSFSFVVDTIGKFFPAMSQMAVPLFMMISGALFFRNYEQKKFFSKMKKRIKSLLVPFLLWNILSMLFNITATCLYSEYFVGRQPFDFTFIYALKCIFLYEQNRQFWFIADLLLYMSISPLIYVLIHNKSCGVAVLLSLIGVHIVGLNLNAVLFDSSTFVYYCIGAFLGVHKFKLLKVRTVVPNALSIFILVFSVGWSYLQMYHSIYLSNYVNQICINFFHYVVYVLWCFAFWSIFDTVITNLSPLKSVFNHSFWVYAMHVNVGGVVAKLLFLILPKSPVMAMVNHSLNMVITLCVISSTAILLNRFCKPLHDVLCGYRA